MINKKGLKNLNIENLKGKKEIFIDTYPDEIQNISNRSLLVRYINDKNYFILKDDSLYICNPFTKLNIDYISISKIGFDIFNTGKEIKDKFELKIEASSLITSIFLHGKDYPYWIKVLKIILQDFNVKFFFIDNGNNG